MFADIASPQTIRNLLVNPHVEINVVDPIVCKGWRFRGTGTVYRDLAPRWLSHFNITRRLQSGYSSLRQLRGSSGCALGVRSSRKLK